MAEGYLTSRSGGYTQVASVPAAEATAAAPKLRRPARPRAPHPVADFGYGRCNLAAFPRAAWLRSVRRVLTGAADERLGYLDGRGAVELRSALAAYLNRVRGTNADPETIVITNGYAQAVSLLMAALAARGARTLAVEDPSASDDARPIAGALGLSVVGVPVGDDGVRVDAVSELRADVLILTPSHQWPTGGVLSPRHAPRYSRGHSGPGRWSSRTTMTPNTGTTAPPSAPCKAWIPAGSPMRGPRARPWRRVPARPAHPAAGTRRAGRRSQAAGRPRLPDPGPAGGGPRRSGRCRRDALPAVASAAWRPHRWILEPQRVDDHRRRHAPDPSRFKPARGHDLTRLTWPGDLRRAARRPHPRNGNRRVQADSRSRRPHETHRRAQPPIDPA